MSSSRIRQARLRPPTLAMLTGQNAVSLPCLWKIPSIYADIGVSATDAVAWIFPFHAMCDLPGLSGSVRDHGADTSDPHAVHVQKMLLRRERLGQCESEARVQLEAYTTNYHTEPHHTANSVHAVWIITSRYGDRVNGNRTRISTEEDLPKRASRTSQCECFRQGLDNMPVIRCSAHSELYLSHGAGECVNLRDTIGNQLDLPVIEFVGQVANLTPPGDNKMEVSCALVREVFLTKNTK
jgi:hypothetical protein